MDLLQRESLPIAEIVLEPPDELEPLEALLHEEQAEVLVLHGLGEPVGPDEFPEGFFVRSVLNGLAIDHEEALPQPSRTLDTSQVEPMIQEVFLEQRLALFFMTLHEVEGPGEFPLLVLLSYCLLEGAKGE